MPYLYKASVDNKVYDFFSIERNFDNLIYKLVSFPVIDSIVIAMTYLLYLKLNPSQAIFRTLVLSCLSIPIWYEIDVLFFYYVFNFDESLVCFVHYHNSNMMKIYGPVVLTVILASLFIIARMKTSKKEKWLLITTALVYSLIHNLYLLLSID
ncbi:MAG: hypothetical protein HRT70_05775 [Flavobacteriaceae bacterium]|nr:hypothetical protein [Flavobacteriaceae bacterium]